MHAWGDIEQYDGDTTKMDFSPVVWVKKKKKFLMFRHRWINPNFSFWLLESAVFLYIYKPQL